ncbi:hypothetical protein BAUCODRAFT_147027 [Baudoinia panamericana UAMH 10762]|uniref:Formin GTPase-binding domain-containing protein n=1 Tax=Baudoinia panamericana (strain UAMH 10762) TaxID=717646 RepID=M2MP83_BAUPA|nr:uncharacterized protein BAUCODRAFT_147027 [Baudoinia panamericana UAMH 10762]EMC98506.1 hypothetical protein BAUCODRAFT_147027 [Baudoinia panamericana UAMH 10762]
MDTNATQTQQRPSYQRNASSKPNLLRSLVASKSRPSSPEPAKRRAAVRTKSVPLLPPDHPHAAKSRPLGELQNNVQSPSSSLSKSGRRGVTANKASKEVEGVKVATKTRDGPDAVMKSKSSTNLAAVFAKLNRSSKDLSATIKKDKENTTPPATSSGQAETPIWSQLASSSKPLSRPSTRDSKSSSNIAEEIEKYTPREYSPSKQRNFAGTLEQPSLRPSLQARPQSAYVPGSESLVGAITRRVSGSRLSTEGRRSEDSASRTSKDSRRRVSGERPVLLKRSSTERKASGSSAEQVLGVNTLSVAKRGGRVMAAVAALQGKGKTDNAPAKPEIELDPKVVDQAFEAVLDSRNIPEPMRQKMRSLTLRVKADFVRQDKGSNMVSNSPNGTVNATHPDAQPTSTAPEASPTDAQLDADYQKSTKRSRPRSRTFTFSKSDKHASTSPSKKQRSQSRSRPVSVHVANDANTITSSTSATTPISPFGSLGRRSAAPAIPADYIAYLRKHTDPTVVEVGRLHKLRILLRNETVAWVDSFLAQGGMSEIVQLLHRLMGLEWREEHEDQLLHETLLCLKGLCTTERAMAELAVVADELFPALLGMLFDDEKKGPAEYATRTVIINVLFNFLATATSSSAATLTERAHRIRSYLGETTKSEDEKPVDFVLTMHTPRPYRLWSREVAMVTKEVFWIFLHNLNVVPRPKASDDTTTNDPARAEVLAATYTHRHFPGSRPPVPAAPYIGGVEWDATTYLTAHLDLLNGVLASLPTATARNNLRAELKASGFEKVMGATLRTCKEKFYSGVHDGLRAWVAAATEDEWETRFVREGPDLEERARSVSPKKSPRKKEEGAPRLEEVKVEALPKLELGFEGERKEGGDDSGWLE